MHICVNLPLLVAGKPETRRYKAVLFIGKAEIALESDIVEAVAKASSERHLLR